MCQNSSLKRSEQIDRCVENGMPEKIVKSVICTLKKRIKNAENSSIEKQETKPIPKTFSIDSQWKPQVPFSTESKIHAPLEELLTKTTKPILTQTNTLKIPKMCGRFQKQNENNKNSKKEQETLLSEDTITDQVENPHIDILSVGTAYTKLFFEYISRTVENLKQTKIFTILTKTTQPAHFIAICILSAVVLLIWPDLIDSKAYGTTTTKKTTAGNNTLAAIVYLGAFATHFGAQIWMTFVSGLSLYFSLPRHIFGQCQQILFPRYFTFNSVLSIISLVIFVKYFLHTWTLGIAVHFATLIINPAIELTVRLYLAPPMLHLMLEKYKIEDAVGSGQEVGSIVQGDLSQCPHYQRMHKTFRRLHMLVAIGNMTILLSTCIQLCFIASKIQFQIS